MRLLIALFTSLSLLTVGCGGGADPAALTQSGYQKLGAGQFDDAIADFGKALEGMQTGDSNYLRAKIGQIEARTQTSAAQAKDEFLALASDMKDAITDRQFNLIGDRLGDANAFNEAIAVLEAGLAAYPESADLKSLLDDLGDRASASGDPAALEALKGLGYVGD